MKKQLTFLVAGAALLGVLGTTAMAGVVNLDDTSNSVDFTASVTEQCNVVALPSAVSFNVANVQSGTNATSDATVSINNIAVASGKKLKLELQANAADFTAPTGGTVTWAASDISWDAAAWTNGTGQALTLSDAGAVEVVTSSANANTLSCTDLTFTLAAKPTVDRAGSHTLAATWKISSVN